MLNISISSRQHLKKIKYTNTSTYRPVQSDLGALYQFLAHWLHMPCHSITENGVLMTNPDYLGQKGVLSMFQGSQITVP